MDLNKKSIRPTRSPPPRWTGTHMDMDVSSPSPPSWTELIPTGSAASPPVDKGSSSSSISSSSSGGNGNMSSTITPPSLARDNNGSSSMTTTTTTVTAEMAAQDQLRVIAAAFETAQLALAASKGRLRDKMASMDAATERAAQLRRRLLARRDTLAAAIQAIVGGTPLHGAPEADDME
ncbi:hypothetical protein BC828DRAFT_378518 [Blastocladiella britannica]|nr:hypothetical protein BC828DRAFT_378518 [Blastocladiella britannica]